jgi:hypothetical protein
MRDDPPSLTVLPPFIQTVIKDYFDRFARGENLGLAGILYCGGYKGG